MHQYWQHICAAAPMHRAGLTLEGIHGALVRVHVLDKLPLVLAACAGGLLLALEGVVGPPVIRVLVLEHARREAVGRGGQVVAADLGEGGLAAGADDEHLLLAPFASLG